MKEAVRFLRSHLLSDEARLKAQFWLKWSHVEKISYD